MTTTDTGGADSSIRYETIGPVARIVQNRPRFRNAQDTAMLDALSAAMRKATDDPAVRVIVIAGEGDHFSAGHDLKEAIAERTSYTPEQRWEYEEQRYFGYALEIWNCPKPTIAQVQGACVAGAFMTANMCDLVVASEDAFFADPVCRTLAAASVEVLVHPWVMGLRSAKEFLLTGDRMSASDAHRLGMVNRVVSRGELEDATLQLANRIAETPPFAAKLIKRSLNRTFDIQGFKAALDAHFDTHQLSHVTHEAMEIRRAGSAAAISKGKAASA